mmetsp:Transcript_139608/g.389399  ORF Transcript_139608/g.389399 Transcript_139608/m.389399 type:complete len:278 (-) Transcript_139608:470-1303(-)
MPSSLLRRPLSAFLSAAAACSCSHADQPLRLLPHVGKAALAHHRHLGLARSAAEPRLEDAERVEEELGVHADQPRGVAPQVGAQALQPVRRHVVGDVRGLRACRLQQRSSPSASAALRHRAGGGEAEEAQGLREQVLYSDEPRLPDVALGPRQVRLELRSAASMGRTCSHESCLHVPWRVAMEVVNLLLPSLAAGLRQEVRGPLGEAAGGRARVTPREAGPCGDLSPPRVVLALQELREHLLQRMPEEDGQRRARYLLVSHLVPRALLVAFQCRARG